MVSLHDAVPAWILTVLFLAQQVGAQPAPCVTPGAPSIVFVPPGNVAVGRTYAIVWTEAANLDLNGVYVIERSPSAPFSPILDSQQTSSTVASFLPPSEGTFYHRVRAVPACDPTKVSPYSGVRSVNVVAGSPSVIFTVQPRAVITTLGDPISDQKTTMTIENIGRGPVQATVLRQEINSIPFFSVVDPAGGDVSSLTLEPKMPKTLEVRFAGVSKDLPASYQGVVFLVGAEPLSITPYAFVNLKVGGAPTATPVFLIRGSPGEYTFFPGYSSSQDDSLRPPISVEIQNPGTSPMELGAEIGPEVWLVPEAGWNALPIAAGASRTVRFFTNRNRAPTGSALPRYTYFTVRNKTGQSARLLVQDNDAISLSTGRGVALDPSVRSFVIPQVLTGTSSGGRTLFTRIRLSNVGGAVVQAELFFTPTDASGLDPLVVKHATVLVPPNDVVTLTDPLAQVFGLVAPANGQIEVRASAEKIPFLTVTSSISAFAPGGGAFGYNMPVAVRGEGARVGSPHRISGLAASAELRATLILAETTGLDGASVALRLFDNEGTQKGTLRVAVPPYGQKEIDNVVAVLGGGTTFGPGWVELLVESGGGSVVGVATLTDIASDSAATQVSQPLSGTAASKLFRILHWGSSANAATKAILVPGIVSGPLSPGSSQTYQTSAGLVASRNATSTFTLRFFDASRGGTLTIRSVTVPAGRTFEYKNVLRDLFQILEAAQGSLIIDTDADAQVYAQLVTSSPGLSKAVLSASLPTVPTDGEGLTSASPALQRPLYFDGLEQSIDPSRGSQWILLLNEIRSQPGTVTIRLYEAGNRILPIAEKNFDIGAFQQLRLDTVFSALGLDSDERRKDRTNVLCAVVGKSGNALVSGTVISVDNRTGETKAHLLTPVGGLPATGVSKATLTPAKSPRRRPVRRGS